MALLFTGFLTAWIIFKSLRNWKLLIFAGGSYLGGLGLSAFFWLPAFYEKNMSILPDFSRMLLIMSIFFIGINFYYLIGDMGGVAQGLETECLSN